MSGDPFQTHCCIIVHVKFISKTLVERVISDHLQVGQVRHGEMGLHMSDNAVNQPLSQAQDKYQKWAGSEILIGMTGIASKVIVMSLA